MVDTAHERRQLTFGTLTPEAPHLTSAPAVICVVDDAIGLVGIMTSLLQIRYGVMNVEALVQTNESAARVAKWVLDQGATALITDNNMQEGTVGVNVIAEIVKNDRERALRMTFIVHTGLAEDARDHLNLFARFFGPEITDRISVLEKGGGLKQLYPLLDARWQPGT